METEILEFLPYFDSQNCQCFNVFKNEVFLQILQKLIQNDKDENQGDAHNFLSGPSINVSIRRNYIYEDAYDKLSPENGMQHFLEKRHLLLKN